MLAYLLFHNAMAIIQAWCSAAGVTPYDKASYHSFTHNFQGYITGTGTIMRLPQSQWSKPEENG